MNDDPIDTSPERVDLPKENEQMMPPLPEPTLEDVEYERWGQNMGSNFYTPDQMHAYARDYAAAEVAKERERCAVLVETHPTYGDMVQSWFNLLAAAIRKGE